jgi:hypothetical protein
MQAKIQLSRAIARINKETSNGTRNVAELFLCSAYSHTPFTKLQLLATDLSATLRERFARYASLYCYPASDVFTENKRKSQCE